MPYPAQLCGPTRAQLRSTMTAYARFIDPSKSVPRDHYSGISIVFGVPGAPRHPLVVCRASATRARLTGTKLNPRNFPDNFQHTTVACRMWASCEISTRFPDCTKREKSRNIKLLALCNGHLPDARTAASAGAAVYEALWHDHDQGAMLRWCFARSARRHYWSTDGREWISIGKSRSYHQALHVARILAGTVGSPIRTRSKALRNSRPRCCLHCGDRLAVAT